ncbi:MAG: FAD:protein FMN transferase [Candidatus Ruthia sp.]|nr:FAD:protein FMN transferase [Candidatus Ruthturnera sp.]MBT4122907.1 FAD:protein FMN transferase [Candidatus Ruthturnera sp.]MBT4668315.1 FAD:protein FMN transferase [Candidatus Ruthturnera sp.]MBT6922232.1 FAD:protein FMN transferase [Candidatus Ruthturnera sp.]
MLRALLIFIFLGLSACGGNQPTQTITGSTMGTSYTVKAIGSSVSKLQIEQALSQVNKTFSTWDKNSELSLLNQKPINKWIDVSDELFFVLSQSQKIHQQTQGYFDPGMGRLIDAWGFGITKTAKKPGRAQVSELLPLSSIQYLQLNNGQVKKTRDIHINLSAIAKGFGVDQVANLLKEHQVKNFLVEIGGEVIASGKKNNKHWALGVERPNGTKPIAIALNNQAIATSGNYRNYFVWEGVRYMHILTPSSGLPAKTDLASVSVLDKQTMMADAYATAMMAMGSEKATALAKQLNLPVVLILNQTNNFKVVKINL